MNSLTIDIGNQRVKVNEWNDNEIVWSCNHSNLPCNEIETRLKGDTISGMIVSSVRNDSDKVVEELKERFGGILVVDFNQEEIQEHYRSKIRYEGKIGTDRIAAYLGALTYSEGPFLIIDAGTAITQDMVDSKGDFYGGNISLGWQTRLDALAKATRQLPEVKEKSDSPKFGHNTLTAIEAGAKNGVAGEILYTIKLAKEDFNIKKVFATGGDIINLQGIIEREMNSHENDSGENNPGDCGQCVVDPYLVGRGLNYHLRKYYFHE